MGWRSLFRQQPDEPDLPTLPPAEGPSKAVDVVVDAEQDEGVRRFVPTGSLPTLGTLVDLSVLGPTRLRPGEAPDPVSGPVHRMLELTWLAAGEVEHRDSLGHRGRMAGPVARLVSGGAGLLDEWGLSRAVRRDGGDVELVTVRWIQPQQGTPTVRLAEQVPVRRQGRSRLWVLTGPDGALPGPLCVVVEVADGATVDLPVVPGDVAVAVRDGTALVGEGLTAVAAGQLAVAAGPETALRVATPLDSPDGAHLLVVGTGEAPAGWSRSDRVVADDAEAVNGVFDQARSGVLGRLPRLDG